MNFQLKKQPLLGKYLKRALILVLVWTSVLPNEVSAQIEPVPESTALFNEAPNLRFEQRSLADGMLQSSANTIMQDKNGYLWISTQGGLHRYDGYEFKVFAATAFDTTGLSDSWVWSAVESSTGELWVATQRGGLNRLNPSTGKAVKYRHDPENPTSISSDNLFHTIEASNGDLWVGTINTGLDRMRVGEDGIFSHHRHDPNNPNSLSSDQVYWLNEDEAGMIWAGTANGINRIDPETEIITRYMNDPNQSPDYESPLNVLSQFIPEDQPGILWLATGNGLVKLNADTGELDRFLIEPNIGGEINPLNFIHEVRPDPKDNNILWVGGPGTGIARFDMRTGSFTSYRKNPRDPYSLRDDLVVSLFVDRSGTMWAGTGNSGINAFNPGALNFTHIKHDPDNNKSLAPGNVWGIYEDSQGTLWVGTDPGSGVDYLTRFDAATRQVIRYQHNPNDPQSILPGAIRVFAEDHVGNLWIGGQGGLSRMDRKSGKVTPFNRALSEENRRRNSIRSIEPLKDDPSLFWVGSIGGLDLFNTKTGIFETIQLSQDSSIEPIVITTLQDSQGVLWVGSDLGLHKVTSSGEVELASAYDPSDTTTISDNSIYSIVERSQEPGILWLGLANGGGLNRYDTETGIAQHITKEDGLADNVIYGVLKDDSENLWLSTNAGIINYNPNINQIRNYGLDDGLMALEYNGNAFAKGSNGMLYFGSSNGVTAFVPEQLSINEIPPQVVIADIKLFNKSLSNDPDTQLILPSAENQELTLKYDENELTIDFAALHFANSEKNLYNYRLEGFDEEWVDAGNTRSASYTNLKPGKYTFQVKAANADGVWNEDGAALQIIVLPPWYMTWWAYLIFACLLGLIVFSVDRLQRSRISRKEGERAALREAELRAEAENKRRADTEELSMIGRAITSSLSMEKIIDTVYEKVNAIMDASVFGVGVYNKKENTIDFPATKEEGKVLPAFSYPMDDKQWLAARCFMNSEEIIIADFEKEYNKYLSSYSAPLAGDSAQSILYLPLVHQGNTIGVITTQSFAVHAYTEYHINLLRNLANYAAIAMGNAYAYRKLDATVNELQATQEQLVHSEKMASLGELTAGIAHEIQNPLNFVNNFSEVNSELIEELLAEVKEGNTKEAQEIAKDLKANEDKIVEHGERASSIVKGMLQHSRSSSDEKEEIDLNAMADEYVRLAYHGLRAKDKSFNANFEVDLDDNLPKVKVIPQDIGRVLLNLINNAFHAVKGEESPTVRVTTKKIKDKVEIIVSDNGSGIPEEIKDKIFQPFFTTKSAGEGTGLGLSLSFDIITKGHGGELSVDSKINEGSKFIIILPTK